MRSLSIILLTVVAILGGSALAAPIVQAHTPSPAACELAWTAAPAGEKFEARQGCLHAQWRHRCLTHPRIVPGFVTVKGLRLSPGKRKGNSPHWRNQREVIAWLVNEGLRRKLPRKVVITAVATGTQESSLRELDHGHGTSAGPFQLIDLHGPARKRQTIEFSGDWFYNGVIRSYRRNPHQSIVDLSHGQQASAHRTAVAKWISEATRTVEIVLTPACRLA